MSLRRLIPVRDGQTIDVLQLETRGIMAMKASDHPVVIDREQAAAIINTLAEAFEFPVHAVMPTSILTVPGILDASELEELRRRHVQNAIARVRGEAVEGSTFAL